VGARGQRRAQPSNAAPGDRALPGHRCGARSGAPVGGGAVRRVAGLLAAAACINRTYVVEDRAAGPGECSGGVGAALPARLAASSGPAYYVAPSGDDAAVGSLALPWRTLDKAFAALAPGEIAYVRAGTYGAPRTRLLFTGAGTAEQPISIVAFPGD